MSLTRDLFIPDGYVSYLEDENNIQVYFNQHALGAIAFEGRKKKPSFHCRFQNLEMLEKYVSNWVKKSIEDYRKRKAYKEAERRLKVGDILYTSWGYEQTNIEFYQVVNLVGKKSVSVREIADERTYEAQDYGTCKPVPNCFIGEAKTCRVQNGDSIRIASYSHAYRCEADDVHNWSSYH